MLMTMPGTPSITANSAAIHQFHVTYCLYGEGFFPEAGFTIRAGSTRDPLVLRFVHEYPPYELPDRWHPESDQPIDALPRLALVRVPGGQTALIHSVPLPPDARGRVNNFFSHVVLRPALSPRDALATWGSPEWDTRSSPGAGPDLPPLAELPGQGTLNDQAVTTFLQASSRRELGAAAPFCPARLADDPSARRELLGLALRGCLTAMQARPGSARCRFYLRAEPALSALLLYAAVRILPPPLVAGLTFSTYENARALPSYRLAQVVGTWPADPSKELEDSFFGTRGFALDTVTRRASPELLEAGGPVVTEWIEMATRGDWKTLDRVYALVGEATGPLVSVKQAFQAARLTQRLVTGRADSVDLVALKRCTDGPALLAQHRDKVRSVLLNADLADPKLRDELADLLPESELLQLEQQIAQALQGGPGADWRSPWRLLKAAIRANPSRLRDSLQRILPPMPFPPGLRVTLLGELSGLQLPPLYQRVSLHALLRGCTSEELKELGSSGVPPEWFSWAISYGLLNEGSQAEAIQRLLGGSDDLLRAFWAQLEFIKDEGQRREVLGPLLSPAQGPGALLLSRSLLTRCTFRPGTLAWLLDELKVYSPAWSDFWRRDGHFARLGEILLELGEEMDPVWGRFCRRIDPDLLMGNADQRAHLEMLVTARNWAGPAMPSKTAGLIADWSLLREHFVAAVAVPVADRQPIIDAYLRLGLDPVDLARRYFERFLKDRELDAEGLGDFAGFFHSSYPDASWFEDHEKRLAGWLEAIRSCPDESRRASYQGYYLEHQIPAPLRQRLVEEARAAGKLLPGALTSMPVPVSQDRAKTQAPVSAVATAPADGLLFDVTGIGSETPYTLKGFLGSGSWMLITLASGCLAALAFGVGMLPPKQVVLLAPFLPLVIGMAEGAALQACVLSGLALRRGGRAGTYLRILLFGACVGGAGGGLAACVALAQGSPVVTWLGVTVFLGVMGGCLSGLALPLAASAARLRGLALGPLARAVACVVATGLFVGVARLLLR